MAYAKGRCMVAYGLTEAGNSLGRVLQMHTVQGTQIDNEQFDEISPFERNTFPEYEQEYGAACDVCADANPMFNCHGMTFASRRTGIFEPSVVNMILKEDGYDEIPPSQVKRGDIIVYYRDGDLEHSGLIVGPPSEDPLKIPLVRSKWAKYRELIHPGNRCPYNFFDVRYFRVK